MEREIITVENRFTHLESRLKKEEERQQKRRRKIESASGNWRYLMQHSDHENRIRCYEENSWRHPERSRLKPLEDRTQEICRILTNLDVEYTAWNHRVRLSEEDHKEFKEFDRFIREYFRYGAQMRTLDEEAYGLLTNQTPSEFVKQLFDSGSPLARHYLRWRINRINHYISVVDKECLAPYELRCFDKEFSE